MIESVLRFFEEVDGAEKTDAIEKLITRGAPSNDFFVFIFLSVAMASFGFLLSSEIILVGSMLVAPMLYPILGLALGLAVSDPRLIKRSVYSVGKSALIGIITGFAVGLLFFPHKVAALSVVGNKGLFMYAIVALCAGLAASIALVKPNLNETLPGVAVSVSLVPPLALIGIAISEFNWAAISFSILLFVTNIIGIVVSAMVVFSLLALYRKRKLAKKVVAETQADINRSQRV